MKFSDLLTIYKSVSRSDLSTLVQGTHAYEHLNKEGANSAVLIKSFADKVLGGDSGGQYYPSSFDVGEWFRSNAQEGDIPGYRFDGESASYTGKNASSYSIAAYADPVLCKKVVAGTGANDLRTDETRVSAIQCITPYIGLGTKDTNMVSLFMNVIPTLEMSKAVPFLEVTFERLSRGGVGPSDYAKQPSLNLFLTGPAAAENAFRSGDRIAQSNVVGVPADRLNKTPDLARSKLIRTGMEMFTTSQVMRSGPTVNNGRYRSILDDNRPFMSIRKFDLNVISAKTETRTGFKSAQLDLTIFDRSRLSEITNLISPGAFFDTYVRVSYGYKFPESDNSAYANVIRAMNVQDEIYNIVNSSYSFTEKGTVDLQLKLSMRGAFDANRVKFEGSKQEPYIALSKSIDQIRKVLGDKLSSIKGMRGSQTTEARGIAILDSISSTGELLPEDAKSQYSEVVKYISSLRCFDAAKKPTSGNKNSASEKQAESERARRRYAAEVRELETKFNDFYQLYIGKNNVQKGQGNFAKVLDDYVAEAMDSLTNPATLDPFLDPEAEYVDKLPASFKAELQSYRTGKSSPKGKKRFCSFAKVMLTFAATPLARNKSAEEVQMIFYPFNDEAGYARSSNIGSFPVDLDILRQAIRDELKRNAVTTLTAGAFINLTITSLIADSASYAYGMRDGYKLTENGKREPVTAGKATLENIQQKLAADLGTAFRMPTVEHFIECRNGRERSSTGREFPVIRIHFFDKAASCYRADREIFEQQKSLADSISSLSLSTTGDNSSGKQKAVAIAQKTTNALLQKDSAESVNPDAAAQRANAVLSKYRDNFSALKAFLSKSVPVINYGTSTSNIISAAFKSQQNKQIENVNAIRANSSGNSEPQNMSQRGAFPLYVQSAQIDVSMIGCPLLAFGQQYFVDFSTGTTIDGIYLVTNINHSIEQGKFTTSFTMTPNDAYGIFRNTENELRKISELLKKTKSELDS